MAKICPFCGSHDTRVAYGNYVGRGALYVTRAALMFGARLTIGLINPSAGQGAAYSVGKTLEPKGSIKSYHCNKCKMDFD